MKSIIQNFQGEAMDQNNMPKRPGGEMRGADSSQPSKSQLLPFSGNALELTSKPYFIPGVIVAIVVPLLFSTGHATVPLSYYGVPVPVPVYTLIIALLLTAGGAYVVNRMVGKPKAWWTVPAVIVFTAALLGTSFFGLIKGVFASGIGEVGGRDGIVLAFFKVFVSIGLPEEIFKAVPIVLGVYIAKKLLTRSPANHPLRQLAVLEPLDGILIGAAAGLGFAFYETMFQYVNGTAILNHLNVAQALYTELLSHGFPQQKLQAAVNTDNAVDMIPAMYHELTRIMDRDAIDFVLKKATAQWQGTGLELLIPRLLGNVMGHSAYSGILGYFIGLAVLKPQSWAKTVLIGLAIAAGLHAIWDATAYTGGGTFWFMLISLLSFVGMTTLIMKGREITPNRSQLVASQLIDRMAGTLSRSQLVPQGFGGAASAARPAAAAVAPASPAAARSPVPAQSITFDDAPDTLFIEIGHARVPVHLGACLFERQAPGTRASRGDSVIGEVNANPNDPSVLGIKNLSGQIWHVTTLEGERRDLAPGRSVRLMRGMQILIGDLNAAVK